MKPDKLILELEYNVSVFDGLLKDLSNDLIYWKPSEDKWCILEIICHLIDEEVEDFRTRVFHTLENPETEPPKIDPSGWVTERKYMDQSFPDKKDEFMHERNTSVVTLKSLHSANWENGYVHPHFGKLTAYDFLQNWVLHDYLHIKQITKLKYDFLVANGSFNYTYAGTWK